MPNKKKQVTHARAPERTDAKDSSILIAWKAWEQGDRHLLLQIWDCYFNDRIPPDLHDIMGRLIEHASLPLAVTKREPGRPKLISRYHDDAQRAELVRTVSWLRKIKPGVSLEHARQLTADRYNISASLVKQYCLAAARKPR